jgi:hypothetical protein
MANIGLGFGYLSTVILYILLPVAWIYLTISCLNRLKKQPLPSTAMAIWVLIITAIPILGAVAYLIVKPSE